jgi:fructuronate reductase
MAVTLKVNGSIQKRVLASVTEALRMDKPEHFERLKMVFRTKSLQMASLTITEKGYNLTGRGEEILPDVAAGNIPLILG